MVTSALAMGVLPFAANTVPETDPTFGRVRSRTIVCPALVNSPIALPQVVVRAVLLYQQPCRLNGPSGNGVSAKDPSAPAVTYGLVASGLLLRTPTDAPGTTAPFASRTTPVTVPEATRTMSASVGVEIAVTVAAARAVNRPDKSFAR